MQTNMRGNLQDNIEQVRPAPDKYNTKYYIEAKTFNLSNKDNYLCNSILLLSYSFTYLLNGMITNYP